MKIKDEKGYITSILLLVLLIPVLLLLVITMEEYNHNMNNSIERIESDKIKTITDDFENQIELITKETLHNVTLEVITTSKPLRDSKKYIKEKIQDAINIQKDNYPNAAIECTVDEIKASNDPFMINIRYTMEITYNNTNKKIEKSREIMIEITDTDYPVYDPLPVLKTGASISNNQVLYQDKLSQYINQINSQAYHNAIESLTIHKCPYEDYSQHGNSNDTIASCIKNHYYHNSHDGMCLLCRLENKTGCDDYGFETFIIPTLIDEKAPASIDHVLLNSHENQYLGNKITINNTTVIYLDNGHKAKYGL